LLDSKNIILYCTEHSTATKVVVSYGAHAYYTYTPLLGNKTINIIFVVLYLLHQFICADVRLHMYNTELSLQKLPISISYSCDPTEQNVLFQWYVSLRFLTL